MFLIRENALKILVDVYQNCNTNFVVKPFNATKYNLTEDEIIKSLRYLVESGYITTVGGLAPTSITITPQGIDKAEDIITLPTQE